MYPTPNADKALSIYRFETSEGYLLNDSISYGQKLIMECILARRAPTPDEKKRIHLEASTQYGKSLAIAAAVSVRSSNKGEQWAVIAPTKEKAQIIMDYAIQFVVADPTLSMLVSLSEENRKLIGQKDKLKERMSKDHITFSSGGGVRTFSAGVSSAKSGNSLMGFGSPNIIEDECYLIDDVTHGKVMRMLGGHKDGFLMKVGNPWFRNHGYQSRIDPAYFKVIIDYKQAIEEGRLTPEFIDEVRSIPNFDILYGCIPPGESSVDDDGWVPLLNDSQIRDALVDETHVLPFGERIDGVDIADGGGNATSIVGRCQNLAKVMFHSPTIRVVEIPSRVLEIANSPWDSRKETAHMKSRVVNVDKNGMGAAPTQIMQAIPELTNRVNGVNVGETPDDKEMFENTRAELYWRLKRWVETGGKLVRDDRWFTLSVIKYKTNARGKVQIISKEELRKKGIVSPDIPDSLSLTFYKGTNNGIVREYTMSGGITPLYGDLPY